MDAMSPYNQDQPRLLEALATLQARVSDLEARLEQRSATEIYLSALHQTALTLMNRLDLHELMATILNHATQLIGTPHGFIQLVEPDGQSMGFKAASGIFEGRWETTWRGDSSLTGAVWEAGQPIVIDDYEGYSGRVHTIPQNMFHAIAVLPLKCAGKFIGVFALAHTEAGRVFSPDDVNLLKGFAELASIALDNAQLYASLQTELAVRADVEAKLRESEERYRIITNLVSDDAYSVRVKPDGELVPEWITHSAASPIVGYTPDEILQRENYAGYHPDDRLRAEQDVARVLQGETVSAEYRVFNKQGDIRWVLISRVPEWDADGLRVVRFYAAAKDVTPRKLAEEKLRESEERYRIVSTLVTDYAYCFRVQPDGSLTQEWLIESVSKMLEYTLDEIRELGQYGIYHPDDRARAQDDVQRVLRGESFSADYRAITKSGQVRWLRIHRVPLWDDDHTRVIRIYGTGKDITEQRRIEQQQLELALERERLQLSVNLMSDLSHDLKTPLSIINTSIYLLERLTDPHKQRDKLEVIKMQTLQLDKLIRDILMLSRLDHVPQLDRANISLNQLIRNIAPRFYALADQNGLTLTVKLADNLPSLPIDEDEFSRVVANLVENAIQYTPGGGAVCVKTSLQAAAAVLEVADTGIGIAEADLPHIFNRFYRADKARTSTHGGTGLGLAIVKKIVEMHGGTVEVESAPGVGSTFRIRLPLPPS